MLPTSLRNTHTPRLRSGVVRYWAGASDMVSRAEIHTTLGIHRRTLYDWFIGRRTPNPSHVWRMCGLMLERDRLVAWNLGATPWLTCLEFLSGETGLTTRRIRSLCRLGGLQKQFSQGATWRLFEFAIWVALRYKPNIFDYVDWEKRAIRFKKGRQPQVRPWQGSRQIRTDETRRRCRAGAVLWLPTDPFDLITDPERTEVISYEPPELTPGVAARQTFELPTDWRPNSDGLSLLAANGQLPARTSQ